MKSIKFVLLFLLLGPATAGVALADHFYGPRVGVYLGPWPLYYPGPGYYPYSGYPVVVAPAAPTVYVEQSPPSINVAPPNSQPVPQPNDWYYCHKPDGYYPYLKTCPSGWERVPASPVDQH